ncbi:chaplin [Streptomyces sp. NPDC059740]|uniref:chaplin n=1 Tax=Streptomyces sp. NPDC059740 TaxID=3346926 RepID=UPI0036599F1C
MRQTLKTGALVAAAASGIFINSGTALADSEAAGAAAGSPGVVSGNAVQVPIDVPINLCGNTVDVISALNPAFGNTCVTPGAHRGRGGHPHGPVRHEDGPAHTERHGPVHSRGPAAAEQDRAGRDGGAQASGTAAHSPGVGSGNLAQIPVDVPVNVCGNSIDVVGLLNPVFGNHCDTVSPHRPPVRHEHRPPHHCSPQHCLPHHHHPDRPGHVQPPASHHEVRHNPPAHHVMTPARPAVERPELAATGVSGQTGLVAALAGGMLLGGVLLKRRAGALR